MEKKKTFVRLVVLLVCIPLAFAAGALFHSQNLFVAIFGAGVVISFALRLLWR